MDEYTPTTEQVREAYQYTDDGLDFQRVARARGTEFDRWLADHDKEVAARAWDEGFDRGFDQDTLRPDAPNPYRGDANA